MDKLLLFIIAAGTIAWFLRLVRVIRLPQKDIYLKPFSGENQQLPSVSILLPARNEEKNIHACITSLLGQDYPDFDIIVINDRSTDRTQVLVEEIKSRLDKDNPGRLKLLNIKDLPAGWTGKTHGLCQGAKIARGEWLLFTDADTIHSPLSLKSSVAYSLERNIDFLSLYPQSRSNSFWEKIAQPLGGSILTIWYPFEKINSPGHKTAFANGQYILIKRDCYAEIGGHEHVRGELLEDVSMAEAAKAIGKNIRMAYGFNLFSTRMYAGLSQIWKGWRRIFRLLMNKKKTRYPLSLFLMLVFSLLPFFILMDASLLSKGGIHAFTYIINLFEVLFICLTMFFIYRLAKSSPVWAIFHPIACLIMTGIILDALLTEILKKPIDWRGTLYQFRRASQL